MFKNISLISTLFILSYSYVWAQPIQDLSVRYPLAASKEKQVVLKNLDFKTVMMAFYQKEIQHIKISQLDNGQAEYVGIQSAQNTGVTENATAVLVFSPAQSYRDIDNEIRYLLSITEVGVDESQENLNFCGVCATFTQIYVFKKNNENQFVLLSKSIQDDGWLRGDLNYLPYPSEDIVKNIKMIGPKLKGYVEEQEYSRQGYSSTRLFIVPLDGNPRLKKLEVAGISHDNEVTGHEKIYNSQGEYHFLASEHDGLYDIAIHYSGTKGVLREGKEDIEVVNESHLYHYNEKKQQYLQVK